MHDRCDPSQSDFSGITNTHEIFRDAESVFIISQPTEFASPGAAVFGDAIPVLLCASIRI
jgi:hypothetical protein